MALSEMIKHHVKEEEKPGEGFFPQARKGDVDVDALGGALQARKHQLLAIKQGELPPPETRSFTGHWKRSASPAICASSPRSRRSTALAGGRPSST